MRVALCDDHTVFADALAVLLQRNGHTVTGVTSSPEAAVDLLRQTATDVCLLDCSFPQANGVDHVAQLRLVAPDCRIILLSAQLDADTVARGAANQVAGFARKQQPLAELLDAIARVMSGQMSIPDDLLVGVLSSGRTAGRAGRGDTRDLCRFFTPRERQVLGGMVRGLGTVELARELKISTTTTRGHVQAVLTKLGVHSRLKAAVLAVREGVVSADTGEWLLPE